MVCGGLPASSLVSLPIVPNAGGDLWWFAVMCGGLSLIPVADYTTLVLTSQPVSLCQFFSATSQSLTHSRSVTM